MKVVDRRDTLRHEQTLAVMSTSAAALHLITGELFLFFYTTQRRNQPQWEKVGTCSVFAALEVRLMYAQERISSTYVVQSGVVPRDNLKVTDDLSNRLHTPNGHLKTPTPRAPAQESRNLAADLMLPSDDCPTTFARSPFSLSSIQHVPRTAQSSTSRTLPLG